MRRFSLLVLVLTTAAPALAAAQSSQFGVRGLGLPGRALSVRAIGTGGSFGPIDVESSQNPAVIGMLGRFNAVFTGLQDFRSVENPAGSESVRQTRFPQISAAGPIPGLPLAAGVSVSTYTNRDFTIGTPGSEVIRGEVVEFTDTIASRGGLNDLQFAVAYRPGTGWLVGAGLHVITGSNRLQSIRVFDDDAYLDIRQRSELSYAGVGVSVGVVRQFSEKLIIAATARSDGNVKVDLDTARIATVDLPYTFGLGVRSRVSSRWNLGAEGRYRTWSAANSDLLAQGGTGADNTVELSFGGEYATDPERPARRPIRFGARYGTLPFPIIPGEQPSEFALSLGTGTRFANERAGLDLALERVWRSAGEYSERAWIVYVGVSVRP